MEQQIRTLTARLLASRSLPRTDPLVRRALVDEAFRVDLDARLSAVGLQLIDNPYAAHVAVALADDVHEPVFGASREYAASNVGLTRDQLALLVVIWALIVLPKRERQINRQKLADDGQSDMFGKDAPPRPRRGSRRRALRSLAACRLRPGAGPQDLRPGQAAVAPRPAGLH